MPGKTGRARPRVGDARGFRVRYSEPIAREICERIAAGESWRSFEGRGPMPCEPTIYVWRNRHPGFAEALAQAREVARERRGHPDQPIERPSIFDRLNPKDMRHQMDEDEPQVKTPAWGMQPKTPDGRGRVSYVRYSEPVVAAICLRLAAGETWASFCNTPGFPSYYACADWRRKKPDFAARIEEARRMGAELRFDRSLDVAAASTPATVNSDKLHAGMLLTHAERMDPDRFAKRPGGTGGAETPVRMIVVRRFERARREDGTEYVRAIDDVQQVEDRR